MTQTIFTQAAVVREFGRPPRYERLEIPGPSSAHEVLVEVLAAGLHPRVRSAADGSHYTSDGVLPLVPGVDGVGPTGQGELLYFVLEDTAFGSMAERVVVDRRRSVTLPPGTDVVKVAAAMNPAMSSWVALTRRLGIGHETGPAAGDPGSGEGARAAGSGDDGFSVAILGATGNAGRLAVAVARHLGATRVVAVGRDAAKLAALEGADEVVTLAELGAAGAVAEVDVVLDYLWGATTAAALPVVLGGRADRSKPLAWVQIGSVAGPEIQLPSYLLRAAALTIVGSGQGSVSTRAIVEELPRIADFVQTIDVSARPVGLTEVETAWEKDTQDRIVFTP